MTLRYFPSGAALALGSLALGSLASGGLLSGGLAYGQTFTEVPSVSQLMGSRYTAFADFDGDGDLDLFVGTGGVHEPEARLYFNDGTGHLERGACEALPVFYLNAFAIGDLDGDGDLDLLANHRVGGSFYDERTDAYLNDGAGAFAPRATGLARVGYDRFDLADVDGDGDLDLLTVGGQDPELHLNDGTGAFGAPPANPFRLEYSRYRYAEFADLDGDGDADVIASDAGQYRADCLVYRNDGAGAFTLEQTHPAETDAWSPIVRAADVDGDGRLDLVTLAEGIGDYAFAYFRKGAGPHEYSAAVSLGAGGDYVGDYELVDLTGDGAPDLIALVEINGRLITRVFANDGRGGFAEELPPAFADMRPEAVRCADVDGDGRADALVSGRYGDYDVELRLYRGRGDGTFAREPGLPLRAVSGGGRALALADVDGDGREDLFAFGHFDHDDDWDQSVSAAGQLYRNDGRGGYTAAAEGFDVPAGGHNWASLGDLDGDGDADLVHGGNDRTSVGLWTNNGWGDFARAYGAGLPRADDVPHALLDVDGDGDLDVAVAGVERHWVAGVLGRFHLNDGTGDFTPAVDSFIVPVTGGDMAFADVDGDGDADLLVVGRPQTRADSVPQVYRNLGGGRFVPDDDFPYDAYARALHLGDVDGDGDVDLLTTSPLTGAAYRGAAVRLLLNDGAGGFRQNVQTPFPQLSDCAAGLGDVDGDGDLDVVLTGRDGDRVPVTLLYHNDGAGGFTEVPNAPFIGLYDAYVAFTDQDGDGDLDILLTGRSSACETAVRLYRNEGAASPVDDPAPRPTLEVEVAPNPVAGGYLRVRAAVSAPGAESPGTYVIHDAVGREIARGALSSAGTAAVSVADWPPGVYAATVRVGQRRGHCAVVVAARR